MFRTGHPDSVSQGPYQEDVDLSDELLNQISDEIIMVFPPLKSGGGPWTLF